MKEIAYYGYTIHWPRKSSANWPPGQSPFEADERLLLQASIHKSIDRIKPNPRIVYRVTNQKETALNRAGGSGRWHFREPQHRLTEHQRINPQEHLLKSIEDRSGKHVSPYGHFTIDPANIPTLAHGFGKPEAGPEVIAIDLEKVEAEFYNSMDPDQVAKYKMTPKAAKFSHSLAEVVILNDFIPMTCIILKTDTDQFLQGLAQGSQKRQTWDDISIQSLRNLNKMVQEVAQLSQSPSEAIAQAERPIMGVSDASVLIHEAKLPWKSYHLSRFNTTSNYSKQSLQAKHERIETRKTQLRTLTAAELTEAWYWCHNCKTWHENRARLRRHATTGKTATSPAKSSLKRRSSEPASNESPACELSSQTRVITDLNTNPPIQSPYLTISKATRRIEHHKISLGNHRL